MKNEKHNLSGFTIIEVMITLAIVGLIMTILFVAVPQASVAQRDAERKAYAREVFHAMEEYYKNNGKFPGTFSSTDYSDFERFLTKYLPSGKDPSTGQSYSLPNTTSSPYGPGVITDPESAAYYGDSTSHNIKPGKGQMYIAAAHWCYSSLPDTRGGEVLSGPSGHPDFNMSAFAVVIYQEHGGFVCLDNYATSGTPFP